MWPPPSHPGLSSWKTVFAISLIRAGWLRVRFGYRVRCLTPFPALADALPRCLQGWTAFLLCPQLFFSVSCSVWQHSFKPGSPEPSSAFWGGGFSQEPSRVTPYFSKQLQGSVFGFCLGKWRATWLPRCFKKPFLLHYLLAALIIIFISSFCVFDVKETVMRNLSWAVEVKK